MLTVGDKFPRFRLTAAVSNNEVPFEVLVDGDLVGQWSVVVAWPKDFTFVCPTEILGYEALRPEFEARGVSLYGLSTDSDYVHSAWRKSREDLGAVGFPWLSDITHSLSRILGILVDGVCMRATYVVDPNLIIRHVTVNDANVGRNPKETLRVLDALQTEKRTPCGWAKGDPTL